MKKPFRLQPNIRTKLLLSYFAFIFLPLAMLTVFSTIQVSAMFEKQVRYSVSQAFNQAGTFLRYKINTMVRISDVIHFNESVQAVLTNQKESYAGDVYAQTADAMALDTYLGSLKNQEDVYRASIYVPGWFVYANQGISFHSIDLFVETPDYARLMLSKDKVIWTAPEMVRNEFASLESVRVVSLLRKIRNSNDIGSVIGVIRLSILESVVANILDNAMATQNSLVFLVNAQGRLICASDTAQAQAFLADEALNKSLIGSERSWDDMALDKKRYSVITQSIGNTDWTMVSVVPHTDVFAQSANIRRLMLTVGFLIGIAAWIVAYMISTSSVKRIRLLAENMRRVQEGELGISMRATSHDEIGEVMETFNYMVRRLGLLLDEQYQAGVNLKNSELKALQSQINPHFLYNTLELIGWKAIDYDAKEINILVKALAKFYKLSLNKGRDFVTIADEINHIRVYVQIQNMRFDNRIRLAIDVEECLLGHSIVKIVLQPIVENAILHGIWCKKDNAAGTVTIRGRLLADEQIILLSVQDDGVGMSEEKRDTLLENRDSNAEHGYGVYNIDQRLKLCYGSPYGLRYHLPLEGGVLVEIRIPYQPVEGGD